MKESNGKRTTKWLDEKEVIHWSTRYFCCSYLIDIFELIITDELSEITVEHTNLYFHQNLVGKYSKNHHASQDIWRVNMLDLSIKIIFIYILMHFCTVDLFITQYTTCIVRMMKYLKYPASENVFPRMTLYLLRNTSTSLIYQNLVKIIIIHPTQI